MVQDLTYAISENPAECAVPSVSIFAESEGSRRELAEDCAAAGMRVKNHSDLARLAELCLFDAFSALGDVIVVECPATDAAQLATLARLDMAVARTARRVVLSTSLDNLDDVFGCMDQCISDIMVKPSRVDRIVLFARLRNMAGGNVVRELSLDDRAAVLRLTEQIERMAHHMSGQAQSGWSAASGSRIVAINQGEASAETSDRPNRSNQAGLPDARTIRLILRQRQQRSQIFGADLFADPAWDMLLDLTAARAEHRRVSVTSLCIASGVPATTALRWIAQMVDAGLIARVRDPDDARRAFVTLTDRGADGMAHYFTQVEGARAVAA